MAWVRILLLFECFGGVPREAALYFFNTSLMDSKGNVRHFFGVLFAWRGFESCCCLSVSEALRQRLSKLETLGIVGVPREAALYLL